MMIFQPIYKILIFIFTCIVFLSTPSLSQSRDARNAIYVEAFGSGILYSVNYERFVSNEFTIRIGFSTFSFNYNTGRDHSTLYIVPIIFNYLLGDGNNKLEIGVGIDYLAVNGESSGDISQVKSTSSSSGIILVGSFGYRYQPSDGGMHFRLFMTPILSPYTGYFKLWFGSSIGICF